MGGLPSGATPPSQRGQGPTYVPGQACCRAFGSAGAVPRLWLCVALGK